MTLPTIRNLNSIICANYIEQFTLSVINSKGISNLIFRLRVRMRASIKCKYIMQVRACACIDVGDFSKSLLSISIHTKYQHWNLFQTISCKLYGERIVLILKYILGLFFDNPNILKFFSIRALPQWKAESAAYKVWYGYHYDFMLMMY